MRSWFHVFVDIPHKNACVYTRKVLSNVSFLFDSWRIDSFLMEFFDFKHYTYLTPGRMRGSDMTVMNRIGADTQYLRDFLKNLIETRL